MTRRARDREALASEKDVADYLGRPPGTLRNWRYRDEGPRYIKVGGRVMYRWSDVDAYLERQASQPA